MNSNPKIYNKGNEWEKKVYHHMAEFLKQKGVIKFGTTHGGNQYRHLLTEEDGHLNFINYDIYKATTERFNDHKAGDRLRIFTNTAASQTFCFNLIIYLQQNLTLTNKLFSELLGKPVKVIHLEPEFTPNYCDTVVGFPRTSEESIGDQGNNHGTDSDIAVFYTYEDGLKGILLIEFKFIEPEFSVCSSYSNKKDVRSICDSSNYYTELITKKKTNESGNFYCGYNRYSNWPLTSKSNVIDIKKVQSSQACPFRFGLNQLWRNMILAEQVSISRKCNEFGFWVFSPVENDKYLWKNGNTERQFRDILTQKGNAHFNKFHLEKIFDILRKSITTTEECQWLNNMEAKYRVI